MEGELGKYMMNQVCDVRVFSGGLSWCGGDAMRLMRQCCCQRVESACNVFAAWFRIVVYER